MFMSLTEVPRVEWQCIGVTLFSPTEVQKKKKKSNFIKQMLCPPFKKQLTCLKEANVHTMFQHILSNSHFF